MADDSIGRRELFRDAAAAAMTLAAGAALVACDDAPPTGPAWAAGVGGGAGPSPELEEATIGQLQAAMAAGRESARSLVEKYRRRIDAMNLRGPELRAVLELDPDADAIAARLDAERAAGKLRGPLHGIPILVKDNLDTGDKMTTTAGSLALEGTRAAADSFVVAQLRAAGAIILGKTNLSEWANFRGSKSSSGWSGRGGQCRNPYALDRSPSGSSSGSGTAAAASLCAAAIGTETDGSIVSPASVAGLVGVKPTIGLVSRSGIIPIAASQDTAGPMARTVTDAALLLSAIAGVDPADPSTTAPGRPAGEEYTRFLDPKALAGARLGVPRKGFVGKHYHADRVLEGMLARLRELGAVIVDPADMEPPPTLPIAEGVVLATEFKVQLDAYLATRGPDTTIRSLADLIAYNKAHADREMPWFGQEAFEGAAAAGAMTDQAYVDARALCLKVCRDDGIDRLIAANNLDALVAVTEGPAWLIDHVAGDGFTGVSCSTHPAVAGYPHVTVPGGVLHGLPIGLSFFGRAFTEGRLLALAYAWEQATAIRRPPRYLATAELG